MTHTISNPSDTTDAADLTELGDRIAEAALTASETGADVAAARTAAATACGVDPLPDDLLAHVLEDVA